MLLNLIQSAPVGLNPYLLTLQAGALGPFNVSVGVAQVGCPCQPQTLNHKPYTPAWPIGR